VVYCPRRTDHTYCSSNLPSEPPDQCVYELRPPPDLDTTEEISTLDYNTTTTLDWNGDGLTDIATMTPNVTPTNSTLQVWVRNGNKPDVLTVVKTGLGAKTTVKYKPLIDSHVYQPGTSCTYPQKCMKNGMWVVSAVLSDRGMSDNGVIVESNDQVSYSYKDGRTDLKGRGFLGFAQRTATRVVTPTSDNGYVGFTESADTYFESAFDPPTNDQFPLAGFATRIDSRITNTTGGVHRGTRQLMVPAIRRGVAGAGSDAQNQRIYHVEVEDMTSTEYENTFADPLPPTIGSMNGWEYKRVTYTHRDRDMYGNVEHERVSTAWRPARNGTPKEAYAETTSFFESAAPTVFSLKRFYGLADSTESFGGYPGGGQSDARIVAYLYLPGDVELAQNSGSTDQPSGGPDIESTMRRVRNSDGLPWEVSIEDTTGRRRTTHFEYDEAEGMYAVRVTNPLGHVTRRSFNAATDTSVWEQDPNGIATKFFFDGFGRPKGMRGPEQTATTVVYARNSDVEPLCVTTSTLGGLSRKRTTRDRLGRPIRDEATDFDGLWLVTSTRFNKLGLVANVTRPYGSSDFTYDDFGRAVVTTRDDEAGTPIPLGFGRAATLRNSYDDYFHTTVIDEVGNRTTTIADGLGQVVTKSERIEGRDVTTTYQYKPFGRVWRTTAPGGVTETNFDVLGRRFDLDTPDTRRTTTFYNAFGDIRGQQDAEGRIEEFELDDLGRPTVRRDIEGAETLSTTFVYDSAPNGIGKLAVGTSADQVITAMSYDSRFGMNERSSLTVPGQNGGEPFVTDFTFDGLARVDEIRYPETGGPRPRFVVKHSYRAASGQLDTVSDGASSSSVYWHANARDALGRIKQETFDNGSVLSTRMYQPASGRLMSIVTERGSGHLQDLRYDFRADGSLSNRRDLHNGFYEAFQYEGTGTSPGCTTLTTRAISGAERPRARSGVRLSRTSTIRIATRDRTL
jgi:hypothetical protein